MISNNIFSLEKVVWKSEDYNKKKWVLQKLNKTKWKEMSILSKEQKNKWGGSVGKVIYHQTGWSEVNSQKTQEKGKTNSYKLSSGLRPQAVATPPTHMQRGE